MNEYARELAQVVVWIGYLQWMTANGFQVNRDPVLEPLETIVAGPGPSSSYPVPPGVHGDAAFFKIRLVE